MSKPLSRLDNAYDEEKYYTTTPVTAVEGAIRVDAHKLLDYARARMQVAILIASDFRKQPQIGVIGFLTGSIGLLATARELLEPLHPGRFNFVMGLGHAKGGDAAEVELHAVLDNLRRKGIRRIVLVDEVKSGGQIRSDLEASLRWVRARGAADIEISAIGVSGAPPKDKERPPTVAEVVAQLEPTQHIVDPRTVITSSLLEMDTPGLHFRGVKRTAHVGEYDFQRDQPEKGLQIVCPAGGPCGDAGVRSLDTAFAGTVNRILGLSNPAQAAQPLKVSEEPDDEDDEPLPPALTWPDTIDLSCQTCRSLLAAARSAAAEWPHLVP